MQLLVLFFFSLKTTALIFQETVLFSLVIGPLVRWSGCHGEEETL